MILLFCVPICAYADEGSGGESVPSSTGDPVAAPAPAQNPEQDTAETAVAVAGSAQLDSIINDGQETLTDQDGSDTPEESSDNVITFENDPVSQTAVNGETTVSESELNAIQKAVNEALNRINEDTTSLHITVEAGTYYGDINIDAQSLTEGTEPSKDLTLTIAAHDAEGEDGSMTNASGDVHVEGNIYIDGINVSLAGLYLSIKSLVEAKNSQTTIYGTVEDDTISVAVGEGATVAIETGDGDDNVKLTASESVSPDAEPDGTSTVSTGRGNDR